MALMGERAYFKSGAEINDLKQKIENLESQLAAADQVVQAAEWLIDSINLDLCGKDHLDHWSSEQTIDAIKKYQTLRKASSGKDGGE